MKIQNTPTIRRMPSYLHRLFQLRLSGQEWVSCAELAEYLSITNIVVRKDVAMTGLSGHKRFGFRVSELIDAIFQFVGWDKVTSAILVGAGALGSALLGFADFREYNFQIESVFDSNPEKIGREIRGYRVCDIAEIQKCLKSVSPMIGILCVPAAEAQSIADIMVSLGIKYIWNFTNVFLNVPEGVFVQSEMIAEGLALLFAKMRHSETSGMLIGDE